MFAFNNLVQKAQSLIDPALSPTLGTSKPSKAGLFRRQFQLPDSQDPLQEINAELTVGSKQVASTGSTSTDRTGERGSHYLGKLHLSESYLSFTTQTTSFLPTASTSASTAFTGQTHGAGSSGNGFTIPLSAIRRVERLNSQSFEFALAITTWNGSPAPEPGAIRRLTLQLSGSKYACERFCDALKKGLREGVGDVAKMRKVVSECYSEYLITNEYKKDKPDTGKDPIIKQPPDAGLGMVFRYPGDAKKLRDRSKMRLWTIYMKGESVMLFSRYILTLLRQRAQRYSSAAADIPQTDPSGSAEPTTRRDLDPDVGLSILATTEPDVI
jgi:hypothetical protein